MSCKVCGVRTGRRIRSSAIVCEACKRFFTRHRTLDSTLRCEKGDNQCLAGGEADGRNLSTSKKGVIWRNICAACRFAKCISIGMNATSKKGKQPVEETTPASSSNGVCASQSVDKLRQETQMKTREIQQLQFQLDMLAFYLICQQN